VSEIEIKMKLLTVQLTSPPKIMIVDDSEISSVFGAEYFSEPDSDQSNGFYDFLRSDRETILGVRWIPFPQAEYILDRIPKTPLVALNSTGSVKCLMVWLRGESKFDDHISDDQWFWWNRIFINKRTGESVLTFGISDLTSAEIASIVQGLGASRTDQMR
jgi:hypothetical protein